jgi:hypothetical protein
MTPEKDGRGQERIAVLARKDEAVRRAAVRDAPTCEELDNVADEVDVSSLAILGCPDAAGGVAQPHTRDGLIEIHISPSKRDELPLSHARLQGDQAEGPVWLNLEVSEEPRKLAVLEVRGLLSLRPGPLRGRELPDGIRVGVSVEHGCLKARAKYTKVFRAG